MGARQPPTPAQSRGARPVAPASGRGGARSSRGGPPPPRRCRSRRRGARSRPCGRCGARRSSGARCARGLPSASHRLRPAPAPARAGARRAGPDSPRTPRVSRPEVEARADRRAGGGARGPAKTSPSSSSRKRAVRALQARRASAVRRLFDLEPRGRRRPPRPARAPAPGCPPARRPCAAPRLRVLAGAATRGAADRAGVAPAGRRSRSTAIRAGDGAQRPARPAAGVEHDVARARRLAGRGLRPAAATASGTSWPVKTGSLMAGARSLRGPGRAGRDDPQGHRLLDDRAEVRRRASTGSSPAGAARNITDQHHRHDHHDALLGRVHGASASSAA